MAPKKPEGKELMKKDDLSRPAPEFTLSQVPTFKARRYKNEDSFKKMKHSKPMDVKFFQDEIKIYKPQKKKSKDKISTAQLKQLPEDENSPDLVRVIVSIQGKQTCHQFSIRDEEKRKIVRQYLTNKQQTQDSQAVSRPTTETPGKPSLGVSRSQSSEDISKGSLKTRYEPSNRSKPTRFRSGLRNADGATTSEVGYDRRSRANSLNTGYEGKDFDSNSDQQTRSDRRSEFSVSYARGGMLPSYSDRSRLSFDRENKYYSEEDEDEDEEEEEDNEEDETYGDDYMSGSSDNSKYAYRSGYSDATVVARPTKPRSLTFYTPFFKVPHHSTP